jgi:hypothetical protein
VSISSPHPANNLPYGNIISSMNHQKEFFHLASTLGVRRLPCGYLGQFNPNYIILRIVENFSKKIPSISKNIVKDNSEYLGIFRLLK